MIFRMTSKGWKGGSLTDLISGGREIQNIEWAATQKLMALKESF
jgi:hypothetical protein